jgi:lactoylglutathione lyase
VQIEHIALWSEDLERLKAFYIEYFGAVPGPLYENAKKHFVSCFLSFDSGARLEIMQKEPLQVGKPANAPESIGWAHFAIAVGSKEAVDVLTARFLADGNSVVGSPRWTGDGYYESVVLDPDGNPVEITI